MNASTEVRAPKPIVSLAMLLAGSLLVGFSAGRWFEWLAPIGLLFLVAWALIARRQVR